MLLRPAPCPHPQRHTLTPRGSPGFGGLAGVTLPCSAVSFRHRLVLGPSGAEKLCAPWSNALRSSACGQKPTSDLHVRKPDIRIDLRGDIRDDRWGDLDFSAPHVQRAKSRRLSRRSTYGLRGVAAHSALVGPPWWYRRALELSVVVSVPWLALG